MDIIQELESCFQFLGCTVTSEILKKCESLCKTYDVSAEDLVDQWSAYTASHLNGAPPTIDALNAMERKEFIKIGNQNTSKRSLASTSFNVLPSTSSFNNADECDVEMDKVASMYDFDTPKKSNQSQKRFHSPDVPTISKKFQPVVVSSSPSLASNISVGSPIVDYSQRTDSGNVLLSYGPSSTFKRTTRFPNYDASIKLWGEKDHWLTADARYMYEIMGGKASALNNTVQWLGNALKEKNKLDPPDNFSRGSGTLTTYGRIKSESGGKLNASSVMLEGSREVAHGNTVSLNLDKLPSYAIFRGQTVALTGSNINGSTLVVHKMYTDATLELPKQPVKFKDPLQIVLAAGPFTLKNDLSYQPLKDLITYVVNNRPHVLILIGPFVDAEHENVVDCTMSETFESLFESLIESIMTPLKLSDTQVVLIASQKDAHHHMVYPTPPYVTRHKYPNLHLMPDPSVLDVDGLVIGMTSADVLFHLGKEELCGGSQTTDRMSRLASNILAQQSFYPLYPPNKEMSVDHELLERYAMLEVTPNILILPSRLRYFIKEMAQFYLFFELGVTRMFCTLALWETGRERSTVAVTSSRPSCLSSKMCFLK